MKALNSRESLYFTLVVTLINCEIPNAFLIYKHLYYKMKTFTENKELFKVVI